jgi:hypothetical protein
MNMARTTNADNHRRAIEIASTAEMAARWAAAPNAAIGTDHREPSRIAPYTTTAQAT